MSKDPVCGKTVEAAQVAGQSEFDGTTYAFCSAQCQRQFDANPHQFVAPKPRPGRIPCCGMGVGMVRRTTQRGIA